MAFRKNDQSSQFVAARATRIGVHGKTHRNYRRNLEIGMIISLIFAILATRWSPNIKIIKHNAELAAISLEAIDLTMLEELPPPPPIVEQPPEEQLVADEIKVLSPEEEKKQLEIETHLELEDDLDDPIAVESSLDTDFNLKSANYRNFDLDMGRLALADKYRAQAHGSSGLDLDLKNDASGRNLNRQIEKVDLQLETKAKDVVEEKKAATETPSSIIEQTADANIVILRPPKSSLALAEYQMWSKLSGQLDRLDKRQFGQNLPNFMKVKDGLCVSFSYQDGTQHEIIWKKGGKTAIKVIGKNRKSSLEELQRALSALLQLSLNYY
ncbi:hypothetical protein JW964_19860 [candidate division KSB1 bacterium]|nr:hypothetical protein [candidate division KSB1 bacterium]